MRSPINLSNKLFKWKTPLKDMHEYPIGVQHQYCFEPELFVFGFKDMHPCERTFIADNKQYWREVTKANIKRIKILNECIAPLELIRNSGESLSPDQSDYFEELTEKISVHKKAVNIASKRRLAGFGVGMTTDRFATRLLKFYLNLVIWERAFENRVFRGNVVEDALGIIQSKIYHSEPYSGNCGINNGALFKQIIADINTHQDQYGNWLFDLAVCTEQMSEKLTRLVSGTGYKSPVFNVKKHFYD